ncbi:MAG TPA: glycosyl transferase family 28 [Acidimicrobiales bacterium]|nr:glycosyl transferase family 28 [Acidimicrobiales bacterium]
MTSRTGRSRGRTSTRSLETAKIFVTVGTDHHPFDRMVNWFDSWLATRDPDQLATLVQRGTSREGRSASVQYLGFEDLQKEIKSADIVVTHGGPGSIIECRRWGKLPIVVPRDPALGEHIDDHQILFCERMAAQGQILLARSAADLAELLDSGLASPRTVEPFDHSHVDRTAARIGSIVDSLVGDRGARS